MKKKVKNMFDLIFGILILVYIPDDLISSWNREGFSLNTLWSAFIVLGGIYFVLRSLFYLTKFGGLLKQKQ